MAGQISTLGGEGVSGLVLNGRAAVEVATRDGELGLSAADLTAEFQLYPREATDLMKKITTQTVGREGATYVRFTHVHKRAMAGECADGTTFRARQPMETCLTVDFNSTADEAEINALFEGWSTMNRDLMSDWYASNITLYNPRTLGAGFDYDDTLHSESIGPITLEVGAEMGLVKFDTTKPIMAQLPYADYVMEKFNLNAEQFTALIEGRLDASVIADRGIKIGEEGIKNPFHWWKFLAENTFQALDANYVIQGFAGLTIGQLRDVIEETKFRHPEFFESAYPEMIRLVNDMNERGICTAVVSSSNFIEVAYALHNAGFKVPLYAVHGTDFYVEHNGEHVLFTNLVNSDPEFLAKYPNPTIVDAINHFADLEILPLVDPVQNGREGKGAAINRIFDRHAQLHGVPAGDMRLIGLFGDSIAVRSGRPGLPAEELGNDQGLLQAAVIGQYFALVNMDRGYGKKVGEGPTGKPIYEVDYSKKRKKFIEYMALVSEFLKVEYGIDVGDLTEETLEGLRGKYPVALQGFFPVHQGVISRDDGMGNFDPRFE